MLLQSLEHVAYRLAGLTSVIYAMEQTNLLQPFLNTNRDVELAARVSLLMSTSEYVSDRLISMVSGTRVPSLATSLQQFGYAFVLNALVYYIFDKFNLDNVIVRPDSTPLMRSVQISALFIIIQEVSARFLRYYMTSAY